MRSAAFLLNGNLRRPFDGISTGAVACTFTLTVLTAVCFRRPVFGGVLPLPVANGSALWPGSSSITNYFPTSLPPSARPNCLPPNRRSAPYREVSRPADWYSRVLPAFKRIHSSCAAAAADALWSYIDVHDVATACLAWLPKVRPTVIPRRRRRADARTAVKTGRRAGYPRPAGCTGDSGCRRHPGRGCPSRGRRFW